jgi:dynein heavy chain
VELRRHNYVTETSYLELITCFKSLYDMKVEKIMMQTNRYEVGLEKLNFAAGQVCSCSVSLGLLYVFLVTEMFCKFSE